MEKLNKNDSWIRPNTKFPSKRLALRELEIPPRPTLNLGGKEPYKGFGPFQGFQKNSPTLFRITWILNLDSNCHAQIDRYEVFVCIQRIKSVCISQWRRIGEIRANSKHFDSGQRKLVVSKRIVGFDPGFRYQIVVRAVDILKREGPFSKPVDVILPQSDV